MYLPLTGWVILNHVAEFVTTVQVQCEGGITLLQGPRAPRGPAGLRLRPGHVEPGLHVCR